MQGQLVPIRAVSILSPWVSCRTTLTEGCGVGWDVPAGCSLCPEGLTSATAWASSCPAWGRGLMGGAPDAHPCLQVQTTTMCISVSLSGTVVLGCLFTPKLHIILFQPQKNVASHRVGTARFSVAAASSSQSHGEHAGAGEGLGDSTPFLVGGSVWAPQHGFLKKSGVWGRAKWEMGGNGGCVPSGSSLSCVPMPEDTAPGRAIIAEETGPLSTPTEGIQLPPGSCHYLRHSLL